MLSNSELSDLAEANTEPMLSNCAMSGLAEPDTDSILSNLVMIVLIISNIE